MVHASFVFNAVVSIRDHWESVESLVMLFVLRVVAALRACGRKRTGLGMTTASCAVARLWRRARAGHARHSYAELRDQKLRQLELELRQAPTDMIETCLNQAITVQSSR